MSELIVKLPSVCACGCMTGKLVAVAAPAPDHAADALCVECGTRRVKVSETTLRTLTAIAQKFAPAEPIVFRSPQSAMEKIEQQDAYLKRNYAPGGRSWFQIITDNLDGGADAEKPPIAGDGFEAGTDDET